MHRAAGHRGRHAAVRAAGSARTGRTRTRSCGATMRRSPRPTGSMSGPGNRGRRGWPVRRPDLQRMGVRQGAAAAARGPRGLRGGRAVGRGGRLDRVAAHRRRRAATPCTAGYKGILQDGGLPGAGSSWPRCTRTSRTSPRQAGASAGPARRAAPGRLTCRGGRTGPACRRASPSPSATSTPMSPRRGAGARPRSHARHHGHVDLPRHERRRAGRSARHVRRGRTADRAGAVGLRGRAERRGRHLRVGRRGPSYRGSTRSQARDRASRCTSC